MADQIPDSTKSVTPGDVMLFAEQAFRNMDVPDLSLGDVDDIRAAMQAVVNRIVSRAAPPAMDREAVVKVREAERICRDTADRATHMLDREDRRWQPTRAHYEGLRNALRNAESTLSTLSADAIRQGEGWQPIKTAPRDGTLLDLWVLFPAHEDMPESSLRRADSFWSEKRQDWMIGNGFALAQYAAKPVATHWMRRPDGPATPASHASDGGE